jgi:hypothetical protein
VARRRSIITGVSIATAALIAITGCGSSKKTSLAEGVAGGAPTSAPGGANERS